MPSSHGDRKLRYGFLFLFGFSLFALAWSIFALAIEFWEHGMQVHSVSMWESVLVQGFISAIWVYASRSLQVEIPGTSVGRLQLILACVDCVLFIGFCALVLLVGFDSEWIAKTIILGVSAAIRMASGVHFVVLLRYL